MGILAMAESIPRRWQWFCQPTVLTSLTHCHQSLLWRVKGPLLYKWRSIASKYVANRKAWLRHSRFTAYLRTLHEKLRSHNRKILREFILSCWCVNIGMCNTVKQNKLLLVSSINDTCFGPSGPSSSTKICAWWLSIRTETCRIYW